MQSKPLDRVYFGQYQASSAGLGGPGDGDSAISCTEHSQVAGFVHTVSGLSSKIGSLYHLAGWHFAGGKYVWQMLVVNQNLTLISLCVILCVPTCMAFCPSLVFV